MISRGNHRSVDLRQHVEGVRPSKRYEVVTYQLKSILTKKALVLLFLDSF